VELTTTRGGVPAAAESQAEERISEDGSSEKSVRAANPARSAFGRATGSIIRPQKTKMACNGAVVNCRTCSKEWYF
jgi:hypothetical protein